MTTAGPMPAVGTRCAAHSRRAACRSVGATARRSGAARRRCATGLGVSGLGEAFDGVEPPIPPLGDLGNGAAGLVEAFGFYPVEDLAALLSAADEPRLFEHHQVFGYGLTGERDLARQPTGAGLTLLDEEIEHPTT